MKRSVILILILIFWIFLFNSCQKREWNNPFDPECPKESWTPTAFIAIQQGNAINLSWVQAVKNISGFRIERKIEGETAWTEVVSQEKTISTWADKSITGGKLYEYRIVALAGNNESNYAMVQITPLLTATLTTSIPSAITTTSALLGGTITTDGGVPITERGVCWATTTNPTTSNNKLAIGTGTGSFSNTITGLTANTTYYIRAYATNSQGTAYGNEVNFKTLNLNEVADIDGNIYHTVTIGNQVWMVENLKTTKYRDGTAIPNVTDNAWTNLVTPGYCWYNNDATTHKSTYGALYNWYAVNTGKLAPLGWHVPTDEEWTTLTTYLGGESIAGGKLKEIGTIHWSTPNTGATNESGFTALPGGYRYGDTFNFIGIQGNWWSSTEVFIYDTWYRVMTNDYSSAYRKYESFESLGFSVRCVKD